MEEYSVKQLSKLAGVSVRALHYYDQIGLLKPSFIKSNGYRVYSEKELLKLQQILFFRELDFPLDEIEGIINAPNFNIPEALAEQRKLLEMKRKRINRLIKTIDKTITNLKGESEMKSNDMFTAFDETKMKEYQEEAKRRWGNTEAHKQSMERIKNWTKADYRRVAEEGRAFTRELGKVMDKGIKSPEAQKLISLHYKGIEQFYDCPLEMYRNLGEMYVVDSRFKQYYDSVRPGLAEFMRDAIAYYVEQRHKR